MYYKHILIYYDACHENLAVIQITSLSCQVYYIHGYPKIMG